MPKTANEHLGNVLLMLSDLVDDDKCEALDKALSFYNEQNPDKQVLQNEGYKTFLVHETPLSRIIKDHNLDDKNTLIAAYDRFYEKLNNGFFKEDYEEICEALGNFRMKHEPPYPVVGTIYPNMVCAMLAVEAMYEWERMEWEKE